MEKVVAADSATQLDEVTVTATRIAAVTYDVPASISSVSGDVFKNSSLGVNLGDDISQVPGLLARNRNNYAQDQQVSIRGYGANSAFGIRGVRIYQDGIPASSPDGQGQVSQFNLETASRVEVLRGPFSSLYGNSSGGVIQIFTADGREPGEIRGGLVGGSFGTIRASVNANDDLGAFAYNAGYAHFQIDGFRDHSEAKNDSFNAKLGYEINEANKLTFVTNVISRPDSQDPLGITQAQFQANPEQTDAAATQFNTRKSTEQEQGGLIYDLQATESQSLRFMGYYGQRKVEQFLAVAVGAQTAATSSGGVIDLDREYAGGDARWTWQGMLADRAISVVAGVSYDKQNEHRKGFNNFIGTTLGVKGALRRDENNITTGTDEYAQASWDLAEKWSLMVGVRHSDVDFDSQDHYIVGTNGNDSGQKSYSDTLPVGGVMFKALPWLHVYASYGEGFQTPIVAELAYRASGGTGLNFNLKPAVSENAELGAKIQSGNFSGEFAVFQAKTEDEIVINTNTGGRATYQNAGRTKRQGVELSVSYRIADNWRTQLAYTYLDATYTDAYLTCIATPCAAPTVPVAAGNRLPGIPENNLYASVRFGGDVGFHASLNAQYVGDVAVNDTNTVLAPSYTIAGVEAGYGMEFNQWRLSAFVRVNNAFDEDYVGSIIVNDGNQRFFEPGPPLAVLAGVNIAWK
jgi:iron complex outermembrane receptor protein